MTKIITGLFENPQDAAAAVHTLEARGIPAKDISIMASESFDKESFAVDSHTKLPEGVAIGASTGGAIGALAAGLTAVGTVATGGTGILVAGPIVAALTGAGAGAAGGGVLGGLVGLAFPEHEVKHYENAIEEGCVLVGIECGKDHADTDQVKDVLDKCSAKKISHA